jgi:hypothetical protein
VILQRWMDARLKSSVDSIDTVSSILFLSPQVGAGWYKSPKEVPLEHHVTRTSWRAPAEPIKDVIPKNTIPETKWSLTSRYPHFVRAPEPLHPMSPDFSEINPANRTITPLSHTQIQTRANAKFNSFYQQSNRSDPELCLKPRTWTLPRNFGCPPLLKSPMSFWSSSSHRAL